MHKIVRKIRRALFWDEPGYHDMFLNEGERFFARLYLHHIRDVIRQHASGPLNLLDAGCQTGRLAIPLARNGHRVTGVDTSSLAVHKARHHAKQTGVQLRLVQADMGHWMPRQPAGHFDAVVCNEVLYLRENWRELLRGLIRLLKPGGLCFISHRPPAFYLKEATGEGKICGSYYNWQKRDELERIYRKNGIQVLKIVPIWPLSRTVNPGKVTEEQRDRLFQEEIAAPNDGGDSRYLLVCGSKLAR
jgi:SAM-dependent methyltransferase